MVPSKGEPPGGGGGGTPDHFLRSGLLRFLSSQSPRLFNDVMISLGMFEAGLGLGLGLGLRL